MKLCYLFIFCLPYFVFSAQKPIASNIQSVTVYLSGAQVTRTANCSLTKGSNEIIFTGLSHKIDESSIQVSGLNGVSILTMGYQINYLDKRESHPKVTAWENAIASAQQDITFLKNKIAGLSEEEKVITTNRMVGTDNQALDLEKVKEISTYYRERITAIKNQIFRTNLEINKHQTTIKDLQQQLAEANNTPDTQQGEIAITFDAPIATTLKVTLKYMVNDAGWVPNYDIKSTGLNAPLNLAYKANVYQNTGKDWEGVRVVLSTGKPDFNISKPKLETHYLDFTSAYSKRYSHIQKKKGYSYNPSVKKVAGTVTDASGQPLPGVNILVKGTQTGTQTDFDGHYELEVPYGQELSFSYLGMHNQDIPLYSSIINLSLEEDASALDEVVVMGYGTSSSTGITGAVGSVTTERLLQGRAAGIQIRGSSSLRGTNARANYQELQPLYIIDGVPLDGYTEGDLDASEIQSIDILKGEDATSLYGSRGTSGVVIITTKKSDSVEGATKTEFVIKKTYDIPSDNDITAIEINSFALPASYEYFAAPIVNENVFLTTSFTDWEKLQLLPGEANIYFEGTYAGKTVLDPYTTKKEMVLSLGIDPNITVSRKQERNFKSRSFSGNNRILNRRYVIEVKNNKGVAISLRLLDRIPKSQNKDIKIDDILIDTADFDSKKGLLTWKLNLMPQEIKTETFGFQVKYPRGRYISL
ncbi:Hypothetical protein I595_271 [Croceitalea dokdonensis DOKDO 023]|uniref:TonB-dependent receptor plug n=1 Tax=Croceitalea dokdonensis DOKDO 023 TaxID=1300341 RepID=A0A0P7AN70_9FLAO|nr:mucoidy inhibitor MuiA family protein [Croceitalea dokdonensis]KPM33368.1 Hypothetical protein I595_271 [Croceitalea dokdonensis DOKDO 023]